VRESARRPFPVDMVSTCSIRFPKVVVAFNLQSGRLGDEHLVFNAGKDSTGELGEAFAMRCVCGR